MGKKDLEMLVAKVSHKHTDQGQKVDSKPGPRDGREYLAQMKWAQHSGGLLLVLLPPLNFLLTLGQVQFARPIVI